MENKTPIFIIQDTTDENSNNMKSDLKRECPKYPDHYGRNGMQSNVKDCIFSVVLHLIATTMISVMS